MKYLLQVFSRRWLLRTAAVVCLVAVCLCLGGARRALGDRPDQQAAARWSGDGTPFAQVSLYLPSSQALTLNSLREARTKLDKALTEASLAPASESARLWLDAAGAELAATAATDRGSVSVTALAVNGDYFQFHPLQLLSGCTFSEADELHDTLVLDELAAWQLFGASDVVGRTVTVNGKLYTVCGVAAMPTDDAAVLTYGSAPRIWLFYDQLFGAEDAGLTFYEAVLPNPYTGYAKKLLENTFSTDALDCASVENSTRFGLSSLWRTLRGLPRAAMRGSQAAYPWWENAAVYCQTRAALLFGGQLLCMVYPLIVLVCLAVWCWKHRRWHISDLKAALERRHQRRLQAAWNAAAHPDALDGLEAELEKQE